MTMSADLTSIDTTRPALKVHLDAEDKELMQFRLEACFMSRWLPIVFLLSREHSAPLFIAVWEVEHYLESIARERDRLKAAYINRCVDMYGVDGLDNDRINLFDRMYDEGGHILVAFVHFIRGIFNFPAYKPVYGTTQEDA